MKASNRDIAKIISESLSYRILHYFTIMKASNRDIAQIIFIGVLLRLPVVWHHSDRGWTRTQSHATLARTPPRPPADPMTEDDLKCVGPQHVLMASTCAIRGSLLSA